jgi:hypothetical protein
MDHKVRDDMVDNRVVNDNHQEGMKRVLQRKAENHMERNEHCSGKMGKHMGSESNWKRSGGSLTPRKA